MAGAVAERVVSFHARTVDRRLFIGSPAIRDLDVARLRALDRPTAFKPELQIGDRTLEVASHKLEGLDHLFEVNPAIAGDLVTSLGISLDVDAIAPNAMEA